MHSSPKQIQLRQLKNYKNKIYNYRSYLEEILGCNAWKVEAVSGGDEEEDRKTKTQLNRARPSLHSLSKIHHRPTLSNSRSADDYPYLFVYIHIYIICICICIYVTVSVWGLNSMEAGGSKASLRIPTRVCEVKPLLICLWALKI